MLHRGIVVIDFGEGWFICFGLGNGATSEAGSISSI